MSEKSISEQIIDEFVNSIKDDEIISSSILEELKKVLESRKPVNRRGFISLLSSGE